jgi:hypothetical protein
MSFLVDPPLSLLDSTFCNAASSLITSVSKSTVSLPDDTSECKIIDLQEKTKTFEKMTVKELKDLCALKGLKTTGRRSDLELRLKSSQSSI